MAQRYEHSRTRTESFDDRRDRRAFCNAMSKGLKQTYDRVASKSVPDDFMALLEQADHKSRA